MQKTQRQEIFDDLIGKKREYILREYGDWGYEVWPMIKLRMQLTAVLATMDQHGLKDTYDPERMLHEQLLVVKDRIDDDLRGAIADEFE